MSLFDYLDAKFTPWQMLAGVVIYFLAVFGGVALAMWIGRNEPWD